MLSFPTSTGALQTWPWAHFLYFEGLKRAQCEKNVGQRDDEKQTAFYNICKFLYRERITNYEAVRNKIFPFYQMLKNRSSLAHYSIKKNASVNDSVERCDI